MIPELGKYAFEVLSSYAASILLLVGVVVMSIWRGRRVKRDLAEVEARQGNQDG